MDGYGVFLMIKLATLKGIIDKELEFDLMWEAGVGLAQEFEKSKFNSDKRGLYDCISEFLTYKDKHITKEQLQITMCGCIDHLNWQFVNEPYDAIDIQNRIDRLTELNTQIKNFK